jgi:SAM-dependent methyltransferase
LAEGVKEGWDDGTRYEEYMGRWSRPVAARFLAWLEVPPGKRWLDLGCGTGALSQAILDCCAPRALLGIDRSAGFVAYAAAHVLGASVRFDVGEAAAIPAPDGAFDAAVSGLMLNFVPDPAAALTEMRRVLAPGGRVGVYLWDYAEGMEWLRYFWDAAVATNPAAAALDEGNRFPLCRPEALRAAFIAAGLADVAVEAIDVPARFAGFDAYWLPLSAGTQYPAPAYYASRPADEQEAMRAYLLGRLPFQDDGALVLNMRAWAAQGSA